MPHRLHAEGFVTIFHHVDPATCRVVNAVADGGGTVCEFTNRIPQAIEAFRAAAALPQTKVAFSPRIAARSRHAAG